MKKLVISLLLVSIVTLLNVSCASSQSTTTIAKGSDISNYNYVVLGSDDSGDAELADILLMVQNDISEKLQVVSPAKAQLLINQGEHILTPKINVKTEKWEGGHTFITVSFYDYETSQSIAVVKSNGIGITIEHDQKLALKALRKELDKTFKHTSLNNEN